MDLLISGVSRLLCAFWDFAVSHLVVSPFVPAAYPLSLLSVLGEQINGFGAQVRQSGQNKTEIRGTCFLAQSRFE
jgi:hypothetical protein